MTAILGWIVFGLIVGVLARLLIPGRQDMSMLMTILLGVIGSVIGGAITWAFRGMPSQGYDSAGFIMSIIGAVVALLIYSNVVKRRHLT